MRKALWAFSLDCASFSATDNGNRVHVRMAEGRGIYLISFQCSGITDIERFSILSLCSLLMLREFLRKSYYQIYNIMSNQKGSRKDVTGFYLFLSFYIEIISRVRDIILELRHAVKIA